MNQKEKRETTTDVTFGKVICNGDRTVETQETKKINPSWDVVDECLWDMFEDYDEFVILTVANASDYIRYVQARQIKDGIIVQLGVEEDDHIKLVEKVCTEEECQNIFFEFYNSSHVKNVEEYKPVEFYK